MREHGATRAQHAFIALAMIGLLHACAASENAEQQHRDQTRDGSQDEHGDAGARDGSVPESSNSDAASGSPDGSHTDHSDADVDGSIDESSDRLDGSVDADVDTTVESDAEVTDATVPAPSDLPYVSEIVSFTAGENAGYGQSDSPEVVYGPPSGRGTGSGALDVMSLGVGGEIVLGFRELDIIDGVGADFIVFENSFWPNNDPTMVFAEPAEVAVSEDGVTWHAFPCDDVGNADGEYAGCAGWTPTLRYDPLLVFPLDPELTGGDAFDLDDLGLDHARYVRIRDLEAMPGSSNTGGFDLDAVGLVHYELRE